MEKLVQDEGRSQGDLTHAATDLQHAADKLEKWDTEIFHKGAASAEERKWANEHSQIESEIEQAAKFIKESQGTASMGLAQEPMTQTSESDVQGHTSLQFKHNSGVNNERYSRQQTAPQSSIPLSNPIFAVILAAIAVMVYTRKTDDSAVRPVQSASSSSYQTVVSTEFDEYGEDDGGSWHRKVPDPGEQLAADTGFS
jgi:hypothetical protein